MKIYAEGNGRAAASLVLASPTAPTFSFQSSSRCLKNFPPEIEAKS
jgi:hypothetical protein